jgi:LysM repeat protein
MFRWLPRISLVAALAAFAPTVAPHAADAQTHPRCGDAVRVQPGNTLRQIAQYCGTTISALMAANPQIYNPNVIHVGQIIHMPGRDAERPRPPAPQPLPPVTQPRPRDPGGPCGTRVIVRPGDTLFRIAMRCETTIGALMRANPQIEGPGQIRVGQVIRMPWAVEPPRAEPPRRPPTQPWQPPVAEMRFTGTVTAEGIECPAVRGDDGRLYTLAGEFGRLRPGDRVQVTGRQAQASFCRQGTTVEVRQLVRLDEPTTPPDRLELTGTLTREGVTCPAMRGDDGRLYTIAGDIGRFEPGDRVQVVGRRAEMSFCMQGTTIELQRIRAAR